MHEPDRRGGPGQRFQQRDHPVRGQELHHHQVDGERLQVRAVADRPGSGALGPSRGVDLPAAALHLVLLVLGDLHRDLGDLVLLVAVNDSEIPGATQIGTAATGALREPLRHLIRGVGPGQV